MVAACTALIGSALGQAGPRGAFAGAACALVLLGRRRVVLAALLTTALAAGLGATARSDPDVPAGIGRLQAVAVIRSDPAPSFAGFAFVATPLGGDLVESRVAVSVGAHPDVAVGDLVDVVGSFTAGPSRLHRSDVVGWITARSVERVGAARGGLGLANAVRSRVHDLYPASLQQGALMRGFLIGDTGAVARSDLEDMRRSGLLHFVAVSGGNVAIFLGMLWLLLGVFPLGLRTRAAVGIGGILLFVLITRWEPSVVRAGLMMGTLLAGRLLGVPVEGWSSFGAALTLVALVAPQLVFDVGFQLSALATAGLLLGSNVWSRRRPAILWRALGATLAAQLAVTPLVILIFGSVPAFSAAANVLAAPLVSMATGLGWAAVVLDSGAAASMAMVLAGWVVRLSGWAAGLPQVGFWGVAALASGLALLNWRPAVTLAATTALMLALSVPAALPAHPHVVFLDVGQGDAILLRSGDGAVVAIDTGPDPVAYAAALRRHGIHRIDLLVLTHSDGDHVGGLGALAGRVTVDRIWYPDFTSPDIWAGLLADFAVPSAATSGGLIATVGDFSLSVLGPQRRFASDNDGSIVLWAEVGDTSIMLAGDAEAVAQSTLPRLRPDVLLVPHHGSATTDLDWLERTAGQVVVLSYGENRYGHPAQPVIDALEAANAMIHRTADGDVMLGAGVGP